MWSRSQRTTMNPSIDYYHDCLLHLEHQISDPFCPCRSCKAWVQSSPLSTKWTQPRSRATGLTRTAVNMSSISGLFEHWPMSRYEPASYLTQVRPSVWALCFVSWRVCRSRVIDGFSGGDQPSYPHNTQKQHTEDTIITHHRFTHAL